MATYYEDSAYQTLGTSAPSGTFTRIASGLSISVGSSYAFRAGSNAFTVVTVSGDGKTEWRTGIVGYKQGNTNLGHTVLNYVISIVSGGLSGVSGIGGENSFTDGLYLLFEVSHNQTITPVKENYIFNPVSFTFDAGSGGGAVVNFTATLVPPDSPPNKPTVSFPTNTDTGIILQPTLSWEVG